MLDFANMAAKSQAASGNAQVRISGAVRAEALVAFGVPLCTRIASARGLVSIGQLSLGDALRLPNGGVAEIAAVIDLPTPSGADAILIRAGALGHGSPVRDIILPMGQGICLASPGLAPLCGRGEALVAAEDLLCLPGVVTTPLAGEPRRHLVLDRPGLLPADGLALTPFLPTAEALQALGAAARTALTRDLPRLRYPGAADALDPGLPWLEAGEVERLADMDSTLGRSGCTLGTIAAAKHPRLQCAPGFSAPLPQQPCSGKSWPSSTTS